MQRQRGQRVCAHHDEVMLLSFVFRFLRGGAVAAADPTAVLPFWE